MYRYPCNKLYLIHILALLINKLFENCSVNTRFFPPKN